LHLPHLQAARSSRYITLSRKDKRFRAPTSGDVRFIIPILWAAISIVLSKPAEESSDSSALPANQLVFWPKEVTLPAGTVLTVRLASTVGSKTSNTGDRFNATIATPVDQTAK